MKPFEGKCSLVFSYSLVAAVALFRIEFTSPFNVVPIFSCLLFFAASRRPESMFCRCLF